MNTENSASGTLAENMTPPASSEQPVVKKPRGFAAMDRSKVSAIASKGGKAAHAAGTAHQFTSSEARIAGKKGGLAKHVSRGGPKKQKTGGLAPEATGRTPDGRPTEPNVG